jgi:hypothetical protein
MRKLLLVVLVVLGATAGTVAAQDSDGDGVVDAQDNCPYLAGAGQKDTDGDGVGDACQCGDANGDGHVDVSDIVAAQAMIDGKSAPSPLCDANNAGGCENGDIAAINAAIYGSCFPVCGRYPTPPAGKTACTAPKP